MSKPTKDTNSADHLQKVTPDQMDGVMALIEQAEKDLAELGLSDGPEDDKRAMADAAADSGVTTSEAAAEEEAAMMEDLGFDTDFFLGNEDLDDDDDINEPLPETADPTKVVPNSSATPEVSIEDFFAEDDDINA